MTHNLRFAEGSIDNEDYDEEDLEYDGEVYDESLSKEEIMEDLKAKRYARKKEKIVPFADLKNVKSKFENLNSDGDTSSGPKPKRYITPPRLKALYEIENTPTERAEGVVGANDKMEDVKPKAGFIRSRKEAFASALEQEGKEARKDQISDIAPGSAKSAAAMFNMSQEERWKRRLENIENSGITIEGEIVEKGLAQARLAMFNDANNNDAKEKITSVGEADSEIFQSARGVAKDRMNMFNNLEQQGKFFSL